MAVDASYGIADSKTNFFLILGKTKKANNYREEWRIQC
jgi:hypothetical protein